METYPAAPVPQFNFQKGVQFRTLISQFENGVEQRRNKWSQGKLSFNLVYNAISEADLDTLWDFYVARQGSFEAFEFEDPTNAETYTVRFVDDSMTYSQFSGVICSTGLNLIQVS